MNHSPIPAYILAGGKSSRFGADKARVEIGGQALLRSLIEALRNSGHTAHVVSDRRSRYRDLEVDCLVDASPECGPAAGLLTAMEHADLLGSDWLLLLSCDQLVWRAAWGDSLWAAVVPGLQAVCFENAGNGTTKPQPLPALYHHSLLSQVRRTVASQAGLKHVLSAARIQTIRVAQEPAQWSFNTPEELRRLQNQLSS